MNFVRVFALAFLICVSRIATAAALTPLAAPVSTEDKAARVMVLAQDAPFLYSAQLLGEMDRPVGDAIKLKGVSMPARVDAKGQLELDVKGDGKFKVIAKQDLISVTLKGEGEKPKTLNVKVQVFKREDGTWAYRNVTQLLVRIESEQFNLIDANGNGIYNEAGVDGITWEGEHYLFPLPAASERWCSPTQNFTGLTLGPWGETPVAQGHPLSTTVAAALPVLKGVNEERVKLGLTPRPEDVKLSADEQKHCAYMSGIGQLTHPEDKGKPGYTEEGNASGLRSILSMGTPAPHVAMMMVQTYFHRQDVIRPGTVAFGVGYEGKYSGIDGRTNIAPVPAGAWPVLCPAPGQSGLALTLCKESPDPTPGDVSAGYPISAYFGTSKLKLVSHSLKAVGPAGAPGQPMPAAKGAAAAVTGENVECYTFDPVSGVEAGFSSYQQCVCIIAKEPLKPNVEYEVNFKVDVEGKPWAKTWRFSTGSGAPARAKPKK